MILWNTHSQISPSFARVSFSHVAITGLTEEEGAKWAPGSVHSELTQLENK